MKILLISHNFAPFIGGIEVMSEMLCDSLVEAGHEVRVLTWTPSSDDTIRPYQIIRVPGILRLIKEHIWADLIFENNPSLRLSWARLLIKRPSIVALHTWIIRPDGSIALRDKLKKAWLKRSTQVIAVSDALRKACDPHAMVIGNPYRSNLFRVMPEIKRDKDFVFLGRLVHDKGAIMAIKALHYFIHNPPVGSTKKETELLLTIIGDGPEKSSLEAEVKKLSLEKNITFTGALEGEDLVACLNAHQYQLVPSTWREPFGIAALEGIACGCIPIVADGGGLPDAVGDAGQIFKRGNMESLIETVKELRSNPLLKSKLQDAALPHLDQFQPEHIMSQYINIVESVYNAKNNYESPNFSSYQQ